MPPTKFSRFKFFHSIPFIKRGYDLTHLLQESGLVVLANFAELNRWSIQFWIFRLLWNRAIRKGSQTIPASTTSGCVVWLIEKVGSQRKCTSHFEGQTQSNEMPIAIFVCQKTVPGYFDSGH